jgi:hypothetical protein
MIFLTTLNLPPDDESDDVVIYGQLMTDAESSCSAGFPKLCIRVARVLPTPLKGRPGPRPDDPLPRSEYVHVILS